MNTFDLLEHKRKHVVEYKDDVPSLEKIKHSLWQAWKTTPSKNNAMAYQVFVWGPDKQKEKEIIYNICQNTCVEIDHQGQPESISKGNKYLKHIKDNPFLFTIHQRLATPNEYYQESIDKNDMYYEQAHESEMPKIINSVAIEVGLFAQNLTSYLIEKDIDVSYNGCFSGNYIDYQKAGLTNITTRPLFMLTCGYGKIYRRRFENDIKPEAEEIIEWV